MEKSKKRRREDVVVEKKLKKTKSTKQNMKKKSQTDGDPVASINNRKVSTKKLFYFRDEKYFSVAFIHSNCKKQLFSL